MTVLGLAHCCASAQLVAQAGPVVDLGAPINEIATAFSDLGGIRYRDAVSALVVDRLERAVVLVDWRSGSSRVIGRTGPGPGEYMLPHGLLASGDSTWLVEGTSRLLQVIRANGTFGDRVDPYSGLRGFGLVQRPNVDAADTQGRLYGRAPPMHRSPDGKVVATDSAPLIRWSPGESVLDTVGYLQLGRDPTRVASPYGVSSRPRAVAFESADEWAVSQTGDVWIVQVAPYGVVRIDAQGRKSTTISLSHEPIPVSDGHRRAFLREVNRPQNMVMFREGAVAGVTRVSPPQFETWEFPKVLPPFLRGGVRASATHVWIRRTVPEGAPVTYDVVDRNGRLQRVHFPPRSFVLGFDPTSVFVVRVDDDDLQYLLRYSLPATLR